MIVNLDILSLETVNTPLQVVDNKTIPAGSTDLEATFAEVMESPLLVDYAEFMDVVGDDLPVDGRSLPLAVEPELLPDQDQLPALEEIEQFVSPDTAILTTQAVVAEAVVPPATIVSNAALTEIDEVKPAIIADAASSRAVDSEKPSGIHKIRPDADPYTRQAIATDRVVMSRAEAAVTLQGNGLDLTQTIESLTPLRPVGPASTDTAPQLQKRPGPEVPASTIPVPTVSVETNDAIQKPALSPVSSTTSAAIVVAPQMPQLATAAPKAPTVVRTSIDVPVFDENWGNALQDRVMWMTTRNVQNAEIRLNPAELGPIRVQVSVQDDAAQLTFTAQQALTRDALEVALPRLREMLSENGLSLGEATVSDGDSGDVHRDSQAQDHSAGDSNRLDDDDMADSATTPLQRNMSSALLDTFV